MRLVSLQGSKTDSPGIAIDAEILDLAAAGALVEEARGLPSSLRPEVAYRHAPREA